MDEGGVMVRRGGILGALCVMLVVGIFGGSAVARSRSTPSSRAARLTTEVSYSPVSDGLIPVATLTAPQLGGAGSFSEVAASGQTVAGVGFDLMSPGSPTGLYAFGRPTDGWSSSVVPAQLSAQNGDGFGAVLASNETVVAADGQLGNSGPATAYVFVRPPGGWSGELQQAATLTAPVLGTGTSVGPGLAMADGSIFMLAGDEVYVFSEPAAGWSGDLQPSATLTTTDDAALGAISASGDTLVALGAATSENPGVNAVYVFTAPASGWSGSMRQTAALPLPTQPEEQSVAVSDHTIIAAGGVTRPDLGGAYVYSEPAGGWAAPIQPAARLSYRHGAELVGPVLRASGNTLGVLLSNPVNHACPCGESIAVISPSRDGWSSTPISTSAQLTGIGGTFGLTGDTLAAGASNGVRVYQLTSSPRISHLHLTGLQADRPQLAVTATQRTGGPALTSLTITLPAALRLSKDAGDAVTVSVPAHEQVKHNALTVRFDHPTSKVSVTVHGRALIESAALRARLTNPPLTHASGRGTLPLKITAELLGVDGSGTSAQITITDDR
jgi:hypothetical protein